MSDTKSNTIEKLWWTTVAFGGNPTPKGPWRTYEDAVKAIDRWSNRLGASAGTLIAVHAVRLYGYKTRAKARVADISDIPDSIRPVRGL